MGDNDRKPEKIDISEVLGSMADGSEETPEIIVLDSEPRGSAGDEALREAVAEKKKYHDLWMRARADFENFRKRIDREREEERGRAGSALARDLLPVADNLERALSGVPAGDPFREGIALILRQFTDCLTKAGLEPIEALGEPFNPVYHEAVATEPTTKIEPNHVLEEIQKGYLFMGKVLRPSLVRVSVSPRGQAAEDGSSGGEEPPGSLGAASGSDGD